MQATVTSRSPRFVLLKNALANVVRGSASALIALLLPPFLVRTLPQAHFGAWSLVLQLSTYVAMLDFGVQTAVGRFVAHADELKDQRQSNRVVSTSLALLSGSTGLALLLIVVLAWQIPRLFGQLPASLHTDTRIAFLLIAGSTALGLPASVFIGVFVGLQRNEVPAAIIAVSRILSAVLVIFVAKLSQNIILMAGMIGVVNLGSYLAQYLACRRLAPRVHIAPTYVSLQTMRDLLNYCVSLSIWSFAMLLISGLDTTLVGIFDFNAVAYYAVVVSLIALVSGIQVAIFNTLIPASAILDARKASQELGDLLISSTRYGVFLLLLTGIPLIFAAKPILSLWVGRVYGEHSTLLLQILVIGNIIRLSSVPYSVLLIGTGQQRRVVVTPLIEGAVNLFVSISAGLLYGAIGVAFGTLSGAIVAVVCNLLFNMPRTTKIPYNPKNYLRDGVMRPLLCMIPFALLFVVPLLAPSLPWFGALSLAVVMLLATIGAVWHWGLAVAERQRIKVFLHRAEQLR